jgi:valyl-tRNA synthetase
MAANEFVPERFQGLDRYEARDSIVAELEELGLLDKIEEHVLMMPYGDRSGVVIEPWLMDQWFVDAKALAEPAIRAVEDGRVRFVPEQWTKTYYEWMGNIQPWCVSRQIWWGHRIPAWYGPDGAIFVEMTGEEADAAASRHYGHPVELHRDPDVLDTWFSSALWPFSTLGWPESTPELARHYPTDVLVTGFDIIFFWVARMMMMGLHFMDDVPFRTVYVHALVRDEKGQKMSKSKGNVIDPLRLIDTYGADALRFTLTALAVQGRDVRLAEGRVEGYRNFCTKLWNAARFCQMNGAAPVPDFNPASCREMVNRWLIGKVVDVVQRTTQALDNYLFNDYADALYQFTWGTFCDWYLEFAKPVLLAGDLAAQAETRAAAGWALDQVLHLLHPVVPFVTEELFQQMADRHGALLTQRPWPAVDQSLVDQDAGAEMDWVVRLISLVRAIRVEMNVPASAKIPLLLKDANETARRRLAGYRHLILPLARLSSADLLDGEAPKGSVLDVLDGAAIVLPIADVIEVSVERARLAREITRLEDEIRRIDRKLGNQDFLGKAPAQVVETERERRDEVMRARAKLDEAARHLAAL